MNESNPAATTEDLEKIMQLLSEYTEKLRAICEEQMENNFRRFQLRAISMIVLMTVLLSVAFLFLDYGVIRSGTTVFVPVTILVAGVTAGMYFFLTTTMSTRRLKYSFHAHEIALTVSKLIALASQYSEHSAKKIADKFEFDLRIAEAEASLHVYRTVFGELQSDIRATTEF